MLNVRYFQMLALLKTEASVVSNTTEQKAVQYGTCRNAFVPDVWGHVSALLLSAGLTGSVTKFSSPDIPEGMGSSCLSCHLSQYDLDSNSPILSHLTFTALPAGFFVTVGLPVFCSCTVWPSGMPLLRRSVLQPAHSSVLSEICLLTYLFQEGKLPSNFLPVLLINDFHRAHRAHTCLLRTDCQPLILSTASFFWVNMRVAFGRITQTLKIPIC